MGKSVWITGASAGIGRALALELAVRGYDLALTARRLEKLEALEGEIAARGVDSRVVIAEHDVRDTSSTREIARKLDEALGGLDIAIANAGIGGSGSVGGRQFHSAQAVIETNLLGAMATVDAAVEIFRERRVPGHVVGITSVAGVRGLPGSAAYSASKAGLSAYLEAARGELARHSISVTDVLPGYIDTAINSHVSKRPFVISAEVGARKIADAIERKKMRAIIPAWPWFVVANFLRNLPAWAWLRMTAKKPRPTSGGQKK